VLVIRYYSSAIYKKIINDKKINRKIKNNYINYTIANNRNKFSLRKRLINRKYITQIRIIIFLKKEI